MGSLLFRPLPVYAFQNECSLTNRVLDRSHFRRTRSARVQFVQFPRTQQRRSKKDCLLPFNKGLMDGRKFRKQVQRRRVREWNDLLESLKVVCSGPYGLLHGRGTFFPVPVPKKLDESTVQGRRQNPRQPAPRANRGCSRSRPDSARWWASRRQEICEAGSGNKESSAELLRLQADYAKSYNDLCKHVGRCEICQLFSFTDHGDGAKDNKLLYARGSSE